MRNIHHWLKQGCFNAISTVAASMLTRWCFNPAWSLGLILGSLSQDFVCWGLFIFYPINQYFFLLLLSAYRFKIRKYTDTVKHNLYTRMTYNVKTDRKADASLRLHICRLIKVFTCPQIHYKIGLLIKVKNSKIRNWSNQALHPTQDIIWKSNRIQEPRSQHLPAGNHKATRNFFFVWFDSLRPLNNLSVMRDVFLGWTSTKLG